MAPRQFINSVALGFRNRPLFGIPIPGWGWSLILNLEIQSMATIINTKLGEHRGKKRVWLEGAKLSRGGLQSWDTL